MLSWLPRPPIVSNLTDLIVDVWPDAVITFGAEGLYWHPDHIAIGTITEEAVARAAVVGPALYNVTLPRGAMTGLVNAVRQRDSTTSPTLWGIGPDRFGLGAPLPSLIVDVSRVVPRKLAAMRCHVSQLAPDSALARASDDEAARWLGIEHFRVSNTSPARASVLERLGESAGAAQIRTAPAHRRTTMTSEAPLAEALLKDLGDRLRGQKKLADKAVAQIDAADWFTPLDQDSNSVGILMKHVGGNLRSRWTDFLTTDGEKPDRRRDGEFEREPGDTVASVNALWEEGWTKLLDTIASLRPDDLLATVKIRGESMSALEAISRSVLHTANHVGQIVMLARHVAGPRWKTLSIPRGASETFNRDMAAQQSGQPSAAADYEKGMLKRVVDQRDLLARAVPRHAQRCQPLHDVGAGGCGPDVLVDVENASVSADVEGPPGGP